MPGVSIILTCLSKGAGTNEAQNLFKKPEPNELKPLKGKSNTPVSALPAYTYSYEYKYQNIRSSK